MICIVWIYYDMYCMDIFSLEGFFLFIVRWSVLRMTIWAVLFLRSILQVLTCL